MAPFWDKAISNRNSKPTKSKHSDASKSYATNDFVTKRFADLNGFTESNNSSETNLTSPKIINNSMVLPMGYIYVDR